MCSVFGCDSWRRSAQRFKLPEDPDRRLEWVEFLFEVNGQRLKESSWTDITICREHFRDDCFENVAPNGSVELKPSTVPSLCVKPEVDEPEPAQVMSEKVEPDETTEVPSQCDELKTYDSPSSCTDEPGLTTKDVPVTPVPSDASDASPSDYSQMLQKIVNIDMIREKAALLQMKGMYVVNENRLLQLLSSKCPLCGSKVKVEKVTHGVLIVLNQQCLQCDYRNQWKSQVNASVLKAAGRDLMSETASDPSDETEESSDQGDVDSDDDWKPAKQGSLADKLRDESDEETEDDEVEEDDGYPPLPPKHGQLCTECGRFFSKRWPHTCEHKSKPYSCNICGKRCVSEVALSSHSRIHDESYEHRCKYCHATFKTKVDKMTHQQIHLTQGKPYKCPDCSETFATNKERQIHLEDHRGPKQLKCHICGIEFNRTLSIQRHLVVHTGVRPFKCSVCQRGFNQAGHLKSHMRLHTGERPYKCPHCDKCFNHNVSLKSHVQRYHTSNSGHEHKRGRIYKTVSIAEDTQVNGSSGLCNAEQEHYKEQLVEKERIEMPKKKKRSTGRPIGRPKRNEAGNLSLAGKKQGPSANNKTGKSKAQALKRIRCSDEECEDEPTEIDVSFDSKEEEEKGRSKKTTVSISKSRGRPSLTQKT